MTPSLPTPIWVTVWSTRSPTSTAPPSSRSTQRQGRSLPPKRVPHAHTLTHTHSLSHTHTNQVAERLGNRASNQKFAGSIPSSAKIKLCAWARHFTLLSSGEWVFTYCKTLWIRSSAKWLTEISHTQTHKPSRTHMGFMNISNHWESEAFNLSIFNCNLTVEQQ